MSGSVRADRLVGGRYRLSQPASSNDWWHGRDELLGRAVTVGEMEIPLGLSAEERAEFRKAAANTAGDQVLDVVEEDGRLYVVTPTTPSAANTPTAETPVVKAEPTQMMRPVASFADVAPQGSVSRERTGRGRGWLLALAAIGAVVVLVAVAAATAGHRTTRTSTSPTSAPPPTAPPTTLAPRTAAPATTPSRPANPAPTRVTTPATTPASAAQTPTNRGSTSSGPDDGSSTGGFNPNDYG